LEIKESDTQMKHYKIIGPEETSEFDIEDNELLEYNVCAEADLSIMLAAGGTLDQPIPMHAPINVRTYPTEKK